MPFRWNPITSNFDLTEEPPAGTGDVFHADPLTNNKVVLGAGTDFIKVSGIEVDASDNMSLVNTLSVIDIATTQQNLDLEPGVDVQVWSAILDQLALLSPTAGDIIYADVDPKWTVLPKGADGEVLKLVGGFPSWEPDATGGDVVGPASAVDGNLASYDGTTGKLIADSGIAVSEVLVDGDIGVNIQAYSAILDQFAGLTPVEGDIIFGNGTPEWDKLAIGAEGEVLRVVSGVPEWTADQSGFTWNTVTGTSQALSVNNGYVGDNAGTITMTLPATAEVGEKICFIQKGAGVIRVGQNAGQTIHAVSSDTTTGVGGYLETIDQWSSFCLVCVTANTDWALESGSHGSLTTT